MKECLDKIKKFKRKWIAIFWEIIFSRFCVNCKKEGKYICNDCALSISEAGLICPSCKKSSYFGEKHWWCRNPKTMLGLVSIWDYDGVIRKAIHHIKYKGVFHASEELIERIIFIFENDRTRFSSFLSFINEEETFITFVPIHKKKKKKRGFDQSEILAKYLARIFNKKQILLLERIKNTKSQIGFKSKKLRTQNIKDAFVFVKPKETVKQVIIVDDVWTSGSTMEECTRLLKRNKIKNIWGFTLARA